MFMKKKKYKMKSTRSKVSVLCKDILHIKIFITLTFNWKALSGM